MKSGVKKVTLWAGDGTDNITLELNRLDAASYFEKNPKTEKDASGQAVYMCDESVLSVVCFELDKFPEIERWMKWKLQVTAQIDLSLPRQFVLWNEPVTVIAWRTYGIQYGDRNRFTLRMQRKGGIHDIVLEDI